MKYSFFIALILSSPIFSQQELDGERVFSIYFGGGSYYIDQEQISELYDFLDEIEDINVCEIEIHGHTDNIGSISYNQWLSEMRSSEVLDHLTNRNIPIEKIRVHDFGELSPVYNNRSWNGKLHNRRVDVIIKRLAT